MLADAMGRPLRFRITAGQAHNITAAPALLERQEADAILADKAYDSNELRETIARMDAQAVIPSKRNRKVFIPHDTELYKQRNRIERCFGRLKHFRRFAPSAAFHQCSASMEPFSCSARYDRRSIHFTGFVHLAAAMIWLR